MTYAADLTTFLLFSGALVMLLQSPGPDMAFVMPHGVAFGPPGGLATDAGIGFAKLVLTSTGLTAFVAAWPLSFDLLHCAGTAYLLYLANQAVYGGRINRASIGTKVLENRCGKISLKRWPAV